VRRTATAADEMRYNRSKQSWLLRATA
jgi:hypothetical protein